MNKKDKIVVGISIGDINGVGIEVILKTFEDKRMLDFCTPLLFGSSKVIAAHKKTLNIETHIHEIKSFNCLG
jgi:4-hydroxythreonine-4-phosphate dehydrogenase